MEGPVDLPERQRTLRAAIDWSYGRLTESQRALHGALAVFSDGAALDDARALAAGPATFLADLEALVGWSLSAATSADGEVRLSMLETVREHALERLRASGTLDELRRRHAERFLELATRCRARALRRRTRPSGSIGSSRVRQHRRPRSTGCSRRGGPRTRCERSPRSSASGARTRTSREARRWLALGSSSARTSLPEVAGGRARGRPRDRRPPRATGTPPSLSSKVRSCSSASSDGQRDAVFCLSELGFIALRRGDSDIASALCQEALETARDLGEARATSGVLAILSEVARAEGEHEQALAFSEEALELRRTLGDALLVIDSMYHVGVSAFGAGDVDRAREVFEAVLALARDLGDSLYTAAALCMLGAIDLLQGDLDTAHERLSESLRTYTELADDRSTAECLCALGGYAAATGDTEKAALLWGAADRFRGDSPLEYAEPAIEARFGPETISALGEQRYEELRAEGTRLGLGVVSKSPGMVVDGQRTE